ncbi:MAG: PEP-CTERM system TPR-repeat protein PrsT [Gammaproteobacteria bacterium]|nr:PEP-CTERM system TPR-repeat protein PrsT [Gammaproteobacteria bacterium]
MSRFERKVMPIFIALIVAACNDGMTESKHLAKAKEYSEKGEYKAAVIELKNTLQKTPDNPLARLELGKLHLKVWNMAAAEKEFIRAQALGVTDGQLLPYLGRSLFYQGKHTKVLELPLEQLRGISRSEVLAQKGLSLVAQGDITKARIMIDQAMGASEVSVHAMVANAQLLGFAKKFEQSRKQLDAVIKVDPEFAPAWSLLGDIELREGNNAAAIDAITKAISLRKNNMSDMLKRAMILIQMKDYDRAQKDIAYLKDKIPMHPGFNYAQGIVHFHNKNLRDAQGAFDLALVDEKRYPLALYYAGLTNFLLGQHERAEKYVTKFFTKSPEFHPARRLLALIQLSRLKYKEAEEVIRPLVEMNGGDAGAMNILATTLLKQGKIDESIDLLNKVVALNPDSPDAQMRLGVGLMISGDDAAGEEHLSTATNLDKTNKRGQIVLILNYLRQKQFERAREAAEQYRDRFSDEAMSYTVLGRVYQLTGKKQEALQAFGTALMIDPGNPSANQNLADLAIADKDYSKARSYYLEVLEKHNNHLSILLRLARLDSIESNEKSMVKYLQRAVEAHPKAVGPRLILARYYLSKGKAERIVALVGEFDQAKMKPPPVLELVSLGRLAKGDFSGAAKMLEQLVALQPNSAEVHYRLANAYSGLNKLTEMRKELVKTVELAPGYLPARMALARDLLRTRENDLATEHLTVLKKNVPDHPEVLKLETAVAMSAGDTEIALKLAESAYQKTPSTGNMLTVARIRWNMDDQDGSIRLQTDWIKGHSDDVKARLALAGNYLLQGKKDAAVEQYRSVLDADDENIIALNNLAWFLRQEEPRKALEFARLAVDLQPGSAHLMDTLAVVLYANSEIAEAEMVIRSAMAKESGNPSIQYHGAMIFAASGNYAEAVPLLDKLVSSNVSFSEQKEAEELLKKLQAKK